MHRTITLLSVTALLITGVAFAQAVEGESGEVIEGCVNPAGIIEVVDSIDDCSGRTNPIRWNEQGPAGPEGPSGDEVDPNPDGVSLFLTIQGYPGPGVGPDRPEAFELTTFEQSFDMVLGTGSGGGGKAEVSDLAMTAEFTPELYALLSPLHQGTVVPSAKLEACLPDTEGECPLTIELENGWLTRLGTVDGAAGKQVDFSFTASKEILSAPAEGSASSVESGWDFLNVRPIGPTPEPVVAPADSTTEATLVLQNVVDTPLYAWSQASTANVTSPMDGSTGGGAVDIGGVDVSVPTGPVTVALFNRLMDGTRVPTATLSGCATAECEDSLLMDSVQVSSLIVSGPMLRSEATLHGGAITWNSPGPAGEFGGTWDWTELTWTDLQP